MVVGEKRDSWSLLKYSGKIKNSVGDQKPSVQKEEPELPRMQHCSKGSIDHSGSQVSCKLAPVKRLLKCQV